MLVFFEIPTGKYMYDRNEHKLINISKEQYDSKMAIKKQETNSPQFESEKNKSIYEIMHPLTKISEFLLANSIENIVLQLTQNCNLHCTYCAYSGNYNNRKHSNRKMTLDIAKNTIDFAIQHSTNTKELVIGFYGGEPLIEAHLIRQVIHYVTKEYPQKKVRFNITTNATLLDDDILNFFEQHNVNIMISIDGPEKIHNRERKFINGDGSYSTVMNNLINMEKKHEMLFDRISSNSVVSYYDDIKNISEFLCNNKIMKKINARLSGISEVGVKDKNKYQKKFSPYNNEIQLKILLLMCGKLKEKHIPKIFLSSVNEIKNTYKILMERKFSNENGHPGGVCVPGCKKTFVDVDGNFYPCEKVTEMPSIQIGNLKSGYDLNKVKMFLNIGKLTEKECNNCWAYNFCTACLAASGDIESSTDTRLENCDKVKKSTLSTFMNIALLQDLGYEFDLNKI